MGRQIQVAHASEDEVVANGLFREYESWWCLPRFLASRGEKPVVVGRCGSLEQVIFPGVAADLIHDRIVRVEDGTGRFHVSPKAGLCLESDSRFVPGRYYFEASEAATSAVVLRAFQGLSRWIKKTHPLRSRDRSTVFVGVVLSEAVRVGAAHVHYAGGKEVPLWEAGAGHA